MADLIMSPDSPLYQSLAKLTKTVDRVFFAGIPGVGKTLLIQQLALIAQRCGRPVYLLQWDAIRYVFEREKYPVVDGITHPVVIRATGVWLRNAILAWTESQSQPPPLLIGELPLVGDRLMSIVRPIDDEAEALLRDERTRFVVPAPSQALRQKIEASRKRTSADPQHEYETHDALPHVVDALWQDVFHVAKVLRLTAETAETPPFSPDLYAAVFQHILRHRNCLVLRVDEILDSRGSVYEYIDSLPQLTLSHEEAGEILARVAGSASVEQLRADGERWYEL